MTSLLFKVFVLFLCFTLVATVLVVPFDDKDKYRPRTVREFIEFFSQQDSAMTFDWLNSQVDSFVEICDTLDAELTRLEDLTLDQNNGVEWYERILYYIEAMFVYLVGIIPVVISFLLILVGLVVDIVETLVWILEVFAFIFTLAPIKQ